MAAIDEGSQAKTNLLDWHAIKPGVTRLIIGKTTQGALKMCFKSY